MDALRQLWNIWSVCWHHTDTTAAKWKLRLWLQACYSTATLKTLRPASHHCLRQEYPRLTPPRPWDTGVPQRCGAHGVALYVGAAGGSHVPQIRQASRRPQPPFPHTPTTCRRWQGVAPELIRQQAGMVGQIRHSARGETPRTAHHSHGWLMPPHTAKQAIPQESDYSHLRTPLTAHHRPSHLSQTWVYLHSSSQSACQLAHPQQHASQLTPFLNPCWAPPPTPTHGWWWSLLAWQPEPVNPPVEELQPLRCSSRERRVPTWHLDYDIDHSSSPDTEVWLITGLGGGGGGGMVVGYVLPCWLWGLTKMKKGHKPLLLPQELIWP